MDGAGDGAGDDNFFGHCRFLPNYLVGDG
jgi:hypothetical protein